MRSALPLTLTLFFTAVVAAAVAQTPEQVTDQLNRSQSGNNAAADAQYQASQDAYQRQQEQYRLDKAAYDAQAARYMAAKDRYAAERARYQRGEWPKRYEKLTFVDSDEVIGAPVETASGRRVGRVEGLARTDGRIAAVRVALTDGAEHVWIERSDLKFDSEDRLLVTDFAEHDLHSMAQETY